MKARYNFWDIERPRNVTRREFNQHQLLVMGEIGTALLSVISAIVTLTGAGDRLRNIATIPVMTIAEATQYGREQAAGSRTDAVKLEGFLQATEPLRMPDAPDQPVIRGRISLKAEAGRQDELISETLMEWDKSATTVFLTDGTARIPITFDLTQIPMQVDRQASAQIRRAGDSARTSIPVAVEYAKQIYPLSERMKAAGSRSSRSTVAVRVSRERFPDGQSVVMIAAVEATPAGSKIIDPLGQRLKIIIGNASDIAQADYQNRIIMGGLSIVMGIAAYFLHRAQSAKWREFVIRSNQPSSQ